MDEIQLDKMLEGEEQKPKDLKVKDLQVIEGETAEVEIPEENNITVDFAVDEESSEDEYGVYEMESTDESSEEEFLPPQPLSGRKRHISEIYENNEHEKMQAESYQQRIQEEKYKRRIEHDSVIQEDLYKKCAYVVIAKRDLGRILDQKHYYTKHSQSVSKNYTTLTSSVLEMRNAVTKTVEMGHDNRRMLVKAVVTLSILITILLVSNLLFFVFVGLDQMPALKSIIQSVITRSPTQIGADGNVVN